ncbi:ParA family protein [Rhizobium sp. RCC_161_2]|uniref:ParA family protein n=1 Tax=Rhizobium sp. RCC_161_2 TaxID=3239219 RepID=UPI003525020B
MARQNGPLAVCVINLKGGVGKSTISALLSRYALLTRQKDILAVDLDPQANLSQALMGHNYNAFLTNRRPSIVEIFNGYKPPSTGRSSPSPLSPTDGIETVWQIGTNSLQVIPSRFDFSDNLTNTLRPDPKVLAKFLAEHYSHKDLIIIDCSPTESIFTHAAYHASGLVLVPVKPEYFATIGFPLLQQSLSLFTDRNRGHQISVAGVVVNNAFYHGGNNGGPEKTRALSEIKVEAARNEWPIFKNEIPFSRGFPKLMRGDYSYSGNADRFSRFAKEFFDSIGL